MTAKEYLSQIRKCDNMIVNKLEEVSRLRRLTLSITPTLKDDVVQTSGNKRRIADALDSVIDLENEINADIDKLVELKREVMSVIDQIEEPLCDLLYKRYFQYKKWEVIALEMNYSFRQTTRMHRQALQKVEHVLNEKRI